MVSVSLQQARLRCCIGSCFLQSSLGRNNSTWLLRYCISLLICSLREQLQQPDQGMQRRNAFRKLSIFRMQCNSTQWRVVCLELLVKLEQLLGLLWWWYPDALPQPELYQPRTRLRWRRLFRSGNRNRKPVLQHPELRLKLFKCEFSLPGWRGQV